MKVESRNLLISSKRMDSKLEIDHMLTVFKKKIWYTQTQVMGSPKLQIGHVLHRMLVHY